MAPMRDKAALGFLLFANAEFTRSCRTLFVATRCVSEEQLLTELDLDLAQTSLRPLGGIDDVTAP